MDIIITLSAAAASLVLLGLAISSMPRPERRVIRVRAEAPRRKI
jgi:hypothetical protein